MDTERSVVPAARDALVAACPVVRKGVPASDAVAGAGGLVPSFVAFPASTDEASALLRVAAAHDLSVVPRGAGTGLGWGLPPVSCDLVIDLQAMDQVIEHAAGDLVARVQAGTTMGNLASVLASAGQQLAVDAPADATVGGVVATGTAGPRRFRYGAPRDLLIGITVVRADGVVAHSGGKVVKNVAGYDLGKLFSGSQGTLGLITEVTFRLHPLPAAVAWVTGDFAPNGPSALAGAASAVTSAAGSALVPSAVELLWTGPPAVLRVGVLLEGTPSGVAERAKQHGRAARESAGAKPTTALAEGPFRLVGSGAGGRRAAHGGQGHVLGKPARRGAGRAGRGGRERGPPARGQRPGGRRAAVRLPGPGHRSRRRGAVRTGAARPAVGRVRRVRGRFRAVPGQHGGTGRAGGGPDGGRRRPAGART